MKRPALLLAAILFIAFALRAYAVLALPFEQDEIYTIHEATELFNSRLKPGVQARPLFFLLMHPIVTALPHTATVLRAMPFLFGLAGLVATWALARKTLGNNAALVVLVLVSLSAWHIGASAFARYYSLLYFLATLVYLFLPSAYDKDLPRYYLISLLALVVGAFTHPSFVFPVAAASLVAMAVRSDGTFAWRWPTPNGWRYLWIPFVTISICGLAAIRVFGGAATAANGSWRGLLASLRLLPAIVDLISPVLCVASAAGAVVLIAHRQTAPRTVENIGSRRLGIMAVAAVAATAAALFALSFHTAIYADYAVAALPLVFISAGGLVHWLQEGLPQARRTGVALALTAIVVAGLIPSTVSFLSDGSRFDYRPAYSRIARDAPELAVMTWPIALQREYAPGLRSYELPHTKAALDELLLREGEAWAVVSVKRYGIVSDENGETQAWLGNHCRMVGQFQRPRFDYRLYLVELWRCKR